MSREKPDRGADLSAEFLPTEPDRPSRPSSVRLSDTLNPQPQPLGERGERDHFSETRFLLAVSFLAFAFLFALGLIARLLPAGRAGF